MPDEIPRFDDWVKSQPKPARSSYDEIIDRNATKNNLDPNLVRAVIGQESSGNPRAVSPKGAGGLMQLMPPTAQRFGVRDVNDPEQNIAGGTKYLKFLSDRYHGNVDKMLAGYNAGEGSVDKYGGVPPFRETQNYVPSVKSRYQKLTGQAYQPQQQEIPKFDDWVKQEAVSRQTKPLIPRVERQPLNVDLSLPKAFQQAVGSARGARKRVQPVGMGDVQQASRMRDPTVAEARLAEEQPIGFSRTGQPSRVTQTSDELRVLKGEQPVNRQEYSRQQDAQARLSRMQDESYREKQAREKKDAEWRAANQPAIDRQAEAYRKDIQKAKAAGGDATKWLTEFVTQAAGQMLEVVPGSTAQIYSEAALKAAEAEGADRSQLSKGIQNIGAGFLGSAPELGAMALGAPPVATFAAGSVIRSKSSDPLEVARAAGQGGATGLAYEIPGSSVLTRAGATGLATAGVDLASGASPKDALISGATNALMRGVPEIGRRGNAQIREATGRDSDQGLQSASTSGSELQPGVQAEPTAQRFQHIQFGEVEVTPDQSGARPGRIKVSEVADPTKQHFVKKSDMQGRGNARMIPIKESPAAEPRTSGLMPQTEAATASPDQSSLAEVVQSASTPQKLENEAKNSQLPVQGSQRQSVEPLVREGENLAELDRRVIKTEDARLAAEREVGEEFQRELIRREKGEVREAQGEMGKSPQMRAADDKAKLATTEAERARAERYFAGGGKAIPHEQSVAASFEHDYYDSPKFFYRIARDLAEKYGAIQSKPSPQVEQNQNLGNAAKNSAIPSAESAPRSADASRELSAAPAIVDAGGRAAPELLTREIAKPEPSVTSARKEMFAADRAELDLPELPAPERKSWQTSLDNAKEKGLDKKADLLAAEVLAKPRSLDDEQTAGLVLRAQELKNGHARVMAEIGEAKDAETIAAKTAERDAIESALDTVTRAAKASGSEKGRTLAAQKLTVNQSFDLVSMIQRAKASRGRDLKPEERAKIETQAKQIEELTQKLADAEDRAKAASLQKEIDRVVRRGRRAETKSTLDDEFAALKAQFAKAKAEMPRVQASGLAGLDPEGVFTKLIGQMARNRVRRGTVHAEALVDEIHSFVKDHLEGITPRDVRDAISGYGMEPKGVQRSPEAIHLAELRSELKRLSAQEDIEAGKRLSPRDKTRQTQLLKQEQELQRRLSEGDFSDKQKRNPPKYSRETFHIQKRINEIKSEYEREHYKATRGVQGKILDTAAGVGNIPKTLLSMGDLSALLRQGGYGVVTHPILSSKAAMDMVKSFSERGFANVEAEIRDNPKFDEAKRNGLEFTGIDQADPRLSHKEEGYLGSNFIDSAAKGRYNPLRVVKGVKDISERTFVSFLDSQRMRLYEHQSGAIRGMKLTPEETAKALKAQAKLINMATGRGNLGRQGNQAAPLLNVAMFSPRLLASRVQILNKMLNPVAWARQPKGSRSLMMKDNAKFLAFTALTLGLAKAAGMQVNLDPDNADFLKLKVGDTRFDHLTGLQQPMRFMLRMVSAIKGGETYAGDTKGKIVMDFARSKAAPAAGYTWDFLEGKNRLSGKKFEALEDAKKNLQPLPYQDFKEAIKNDGALRGIVEAFPSLLGVGTQTYKDPSERPTTHAEKLARRMIIRKMPDEARDQEEIDKGQQVSELRSRSRKGEDVTQGLAALKGKITERQAKAILGARNKTRLQEDTNRLGIKDALLVYQVATPAQRAELNDVIEKKIKLIDLLPVEDQPAVRQRVNDFGIKTQGIRPSRSESLRPERPSRQ